MPSVPQQDPDLADPTAIRGQATLPRVAVDEHRLENVHQALWSQRPIGFPFAGRLVIRTVVVITLFPCLYFACQPTRLIFIFPIFLSGHASADLSTAFALAQDGVMGSWLHAASIWGMEANRQASAATLHPGRCTICIRGSRIAQWRIKFR